MPRFEGPDYLATMKTYLRDKYRSGRPGVIVVAGADALRFLQQYRADLFPGAPVVHGAVERDELERAPGALPPT